MKLSVIQRSILGLSVALMLALLVAVWTYHTIQLSLESEYWVDHTNEVLNEMSSLGGRLTDMVTACRDYVATGSEDNRKRIEPLANDANSHLALLHRIVIDNADHQRRLDEAGPRIQQLIESALAIRANSQPPAQATDALTPIREALRVQFRDMRIAEQHLMRDRLEAQRSAIRQSMAFAVTGSGLTLFLLAASAYLLFREIRERTKTERTLVDKSTQLAAANKELESFSYSVSHDLRAPLRSMSGFAKILEEDYGPGLANGGMRYIGLIQKNAEKMGSLIDDLLAFSRLNRQTMMRSLVRPAALVRETFDSLEADRDGRQVELVIADLPSCEADHNLLRQVFVNLLSNALKFTRTRTAARIEVGSRSDDGQTVYFVRDNGVGFDMRYVDKLFNVFQRLHRVEDYEGTGVGLAVVQRIVARHGGRIWAESILDQGATFYFTLSGEASSA